MPKKSSLELKATSTKQNTEGLPPKINLKDRFFEVTETQYSITEWGRSLFSMDPKVRGQALLEETIELVLELGLDWDEIRRIVAISLQKTKQKYSPTAVEEEAADVNICLQYLASAFAFDLRAATNRKMTKNRARPSTYYKRKEKQKRKLGMLR